MPSVQIGDKWLLERHIVYCEDTSCDKFVGFVPSEVALAIVTPSLGWNHNYSIDKARVVVVIVEENGIYNFCTRQRMPFKFEFLIDNFYIAVFSSQSIDKPIKPSEIEGIEGIVSFFINHYTSRGNFVLAPFIRHGEILITCERMGRICLAGDNEPHLISRAIARWEQWTNKQAKKELK
ncbi:MAG: hypothetical protein QNJ72_34985 [Pleurocapsa sp. MO_226.B13]|nr:hypothetical protein [Pleurocapsa sp. MO_226.B13]